MAPSSNQGMLELTAVVWQEGDDFVSLCPELDVSSCGSNVEDAVAMLQEAVDLFLENARELDLFEDTIEGLNFARRWTTSIRVAV